MARHINYRGAVNRETLLSMRAEFAARGEQLRGQMQEYLDAVAELDRRIGALDAQPPDTPPAATIPEAWRTA